jgi:hypothetical protein
MLRFFKFLMTVAGLHAAVQCSCAQHEIFDQDVIQKWQAYEVFSHRLQGTARSKGNLDGKPQESIKEYKQNDKCALSIEPNNRESSLSICSLINPHYMATISFRMPDLSNAVLQKYTPLSRDTEVSKLIEGVFCATSRHFCYGSTLRLRQVVSDPSFKVTKVAKETQNGQELIRVEHTYNYVLNSANNSPHVETNGSLWLDPSRCWCIRRLKSSAESTTRGERVSKTELEFECETIDHPSGFPILKARTDHYKRFDYKTKRTNEGTTKTDYELEVNDSLPDSEFTLSAFNLPEPAGMEPVKKPIPMYVWILIAAGVCGVMAIAFRYLARRRRPAEAT